MLYGQLNRVLARPVQLDPNADILFGNLDNPRATVFNATPNIGNANNPCLAREPCPPSFAWDTEAGKVEGAGINTTRVVTIKPGEVTRVELKLP